MESRSGRRGGFTLIEILVVLVVGGILLLGARTLTIQLAADTDRIAVNAAASDRESNADHLLRMLFLRLDPSVANLVGGPAEANFNTWCESPEGWLELCNVAVTLRSVEDGHALKIRFSTGEEIEVRRGFGSGAFRYLSAPDHGGTWLPTWESLITSPLAVAVVLDADTMILRIGERG